MGTRGSVKHLFHEFQNSLGDKRTEWREYPDERRLAHHSRLHEMVRCARERKEFLPDELESLRKLLCELLSEESCAEWLGYTDLSRPDTLPPMRHLAGFIREPDWTEQENVQKLRSYRAAAFVEFLRPGVIDWETPHIPSMELVEKFIGVFIRPGISGEEQKDLMDDLTRPGVPLEAITTNERGPRLRLSASDLRYVRDTSDLSHEERAEAWDKRTPKPFQPFGGSNLEMYRNKGLRDTWRSAVNRLLRKTKESWKSDTEGGEREPN